MKSYKQKKYEQALIETYLKFDELLRIEKVDEFLKSNASTANKDRNLNVKFLNEESQSKQSENKQKPKRYENSDTACSSNKIDRTNIELKSIKINENRNILDDSIFSTSNVDLNDNLEETIIDANIYSTSKSDSICDSNDNTPESLKSSEDSISYESIILNNHKLKISSKKDSSDRRITKNYDTLISRDMGTTANILFIKNNQFFLANVGDSMAVLFKNGKAIRLNEEHKVTLQSELSRINKSRSRIINNRIEGRLNLTRAIGKIKHDLI